MLLDLLVPNICGARLQYCGCRGAIWWFFDTHSASNLRIWTWQHVNWLYWIFMFQKKLISNMPLSNTQTDIQKTFSSLNVAPGVVILKLKRNNLNFYTYWRPYMLIAVSEILDAAHRSTLVSWFFYLGQLAAFRTSVWTLKVIISICSHVSSKSKFQSVHMSQAKVNINLFTCLKQK
jgi:hypothetical protein